MHLVYLPPPPHKFCLTIVFDFSWDDCNTQKKLETMVMEKLVGGGGGVRATRCTVLYVKMVNGLLRTFSFLKGVYKWILKLHCCSQSTFLNEKLCQWTSCNILPRVVTVYLLHVRKWIVVCVQGFPSISSGVIPFLTWINLYLKLKRYIQYSSTFVVVS